MEIKIRLIQERGFLDVVSEIERYNSKLDLSLFPPGRSFVTYIFPDEWYDSLSDFDRLRITAFKV